MGKLEFIVKLLDFFCLSNRQMFRQIKDIFWTAIKNAVIDIIYNDRLLPKSIPKTYFNAYTWYLIERMAQYPAFVTLPSFGTLRSRYPENNVLPALLISKSHLLYPSEKSLSQVVTIFSKVSGFLKSQTTSVNPVRSKIR